MEFKKLSEVQLVGAAVDAANVLIEENGEIKRVPKNEVGGTGFPTVIMEHAMYATAIEVMHSGGLEESSVQTVETGEQGYFVSGLTFEEAYEEILNGGVVKAIQKGSIGDFPGILPGSVAFMGTTGGEPCLELIFVDPYFGGYSCYYWTANGISDMAPGESSGEPK